MALTYYNHKMKKTYKTPLTIEMNMTAGESLLVSSPSVTVNRGEFMDDDDFASRELFWLDEG
jgi:hypothetical protein